MGRSILVGKKSSEKIFALAIVPLETKNPYRGVVMANEKNLKPPRTKSEARERGKKGGKKSGEARRERKALKEQLLLLLETGNARQELCTALLDKALSGDVRAFEVIRDTIGEKPVEKVAQTDGDGNDVPKNDLSKVPTEILLQMAKAAGADINDDDEDGNNAT